MKLISSSGCNYLINISLLLFVVLLFYTGEPQSEFWWSDESRHAMDGVFFYDFFRDLPLNNLMSYLEEYIVRFPAISFTWNLPFFAIVSAPFYGLFGISVFTAQLVVFVFACVLSISMYAWGKEFASSIVAGIAVVLFFLNDLFLLWMRSVMLEIPALTMMFLLSLAFKKYIHYPSYRNALFAGCIGFAMLMTKQITLFMLPVLVIYSWYRKKLPNLWDKRAWPAYFFIILGVAGIAIHALTIGASGFHGVSNTASNVFPLLVYERLPLLAVVAYDFFSWPILLSAMLGIALGIRTGASRKVYFLLSWVVFGGLFIAFLTSKAGNILRYCIYIAPPLYLLSISTLDYIRKYTVQYYVFVGILACIGVWSAVAALQQKQPYLRGYDEVAKFVYELPEKRPVLFCCDHDGNYIFSMRALDKERHTITLRADKLLVTIVISPIRGVLSHTKDRQQIAQLLDTYGVGYLVIEEGTYTQVKEFKMLREFVRGSQFEKLKTFTISSGDGSYKGWGAGNDTVVNIYRYINAKLIKDGKISIPLPRFNRAAVLDVY